MDAALRQTILQRANERCEYCRLPQAAVRFAPFHVEHVIARQHGGGGIPDNLALACDRCNLYKGPNLTAIDPQTDEIVRLFDPRRQSWEKHFRFDGSRIVGLSPTGRATVRLLNMNAQRRIQLRVALAATDRLH